MKSILLIICLGIFPFQQQIPINIYLVGDSTMANKPLDDNPEKGWGQIFPAFFKENVRIENHAKNGRSTKSFIDEGRWDSVMVKAKKGDYVFIQFGHNDSKKEDPKRYAEPHTTYKDNLIRFVDDCQKNEVIPVLLTPVVRRRFDENGKFYDTHGEYPSVVIEVAKDKNVLLIELNATSGKLVSEFGPEKSKDLYLHIEPSKYKSLPNGKKDDTHFSELGATKMAELVVEGLKELKIDLVNYLKK